jgi:site-specific recombinase XerD
MDEPAADSPAPRKKRKAKKIPVCLWETEIGALLAAAVAKRDSAKTATKRRNAERDRLMIEIKSTMGPRVAELCGIRIEHCDFGRGSILIYQGKGGKDRLVAIPARLVEQLQVWIGDRRTGFLFAGPKGKRMSTRTFRSNLKKLAQAADLQRRVHPHSLRHTAANQMLAKGALLTDVQGALGHSHISTTAIYLHTDVRRQKSFMDKM